MNQSNHQTINQSVNQPISQTITQSINQPINQPNSQSINQSINQSISQTSNYGSIFVLIMLPALNTIGIFAKACRKSRIGAALEGDGHSISYVSWLILVT